MSDYDRMAADHPHREPVELENLARSAREAWTAPRTYHVGPRLRAATTTPGRKLCAKHAAATLRAWVDRMHDERPTRDELRAWALEVLDDRERLIETVAGLGRELDAVIAQRDDVGDQVDKLRTRLIRAQRERDSFRIQAASANRISARNGDLRDENAALLARAEEAERERDAVIREAQSGEEATPLAEKTCGHGRRVRVMSVSDGVAVMLVDGELKVGVDPATGRAGEK